jgi:imidazolonepropionase-like amidohydrolase
VLQDAGPVRVHVTANGGISGIKLDEKYAEVQRKFLLAREACWPSIALAREYGLKLALGTDAMHGRLPDEAIVAVRGGYSPTEALTSATRNGALVCGVYDRAGSLEAGKDADILGVRGNPLDDITALKQTLQVWRAGAAVLSD